MRMRASIVVTGLLLLTAACGDDGAPSADSTTTTSASTTTSAATTTEPEPTTTIATSTTTTTTAPILPPVLFLPGGIGFATFGDDPETVLATAASIFGAATTDSGWLPGGFGDHGVCPGSEFRQVTFGTLMLMFSDVGYFAPEGVRNFIHYSYSSPTKTPLTPGPPSSIDVGSTVAQVQALWPAAVVEGDDPLYGPIFYYDPSTETFEYLFGTLTGINPGDVVRYVAGGVGCGE